MTNRVWIGGGSNRANSAADWSPNGAPVAGDILTVPQSATINVSGDNLKGDTLLLGTGQSSVTDTFNLSGHASLTVNPVSFATVNATVNVRGSDTVRVTADNSYPSTEQVTVNLLGRSTVAETFDQQLSGGITFNGGAGSKVNNDGQSSLQGTHAVINPDVVGTGSFNVGIAQAQLGFLEFGGKVADTQSIKLSGYEYRGPVTLKIDQASQFHAPIDFNDAIVDLVGVQASSYAYDNNVLSLYGGNGKLVDTLKITNNSALNGKPAQLEVSQNASDVFITTKGFSTPSGNEILPIRSALA